MGPPMADFSLFLQQENRPPLLPGLMRKSTPAWHWVDRAFDVGWRCAVRSREPRWGGGNYRQLATTCEGTVRPLTVKVGRHRSCNERVVANA
jgi:hypothetical protein